MSTLTSIGDGWSITNPSWTPVYNDPFITTTTLNNVWINPNTNVVYTPIQLAYFIIDDKSKEDENTFMGRFNDIIGNDILFYPQIVGKKMEPLETIMKYIKLKKKFNIKLTRTGYNIEIKGVLLINLSNMLSKDSDTVLKVSFEYDELVYDNTLLSLEEKRSIKINDIMKNIKKDVI